MNPRRALPVVLAAVLAAGCGVNLRNIESGASFAAPSGVTSRTSPKLAVHPIKRIAVLPFRNESRVEKAGVQIANIFYQGLVPATRYEVQPPPEVSEEGDVRFEFRLRGRRSEGIRNQEEDAAWLQNKVKKFVSSVQPYLTNLEIVYPGEHFEGRVEPAGRTSIPGNSVPGAALRGTVAQSSGEASDEPPLDAVLTGVITKYRNRSHGALLGDKGPHVTYTAYLVSTRSGEILWEASFNEEQIFLLDNLLLFARYAEHGLLWQRNDQLARSGLKRVLATFPGLKEKLGEKLETRPQTPGS